MEVARKSLQKLKKGVGTDALQKGVALMRDLLTPHIETVVFEVTRDGVTRRLTYPLEGEKRAQIELLKSNITRQNPDLSKVSSEEDVHSGIRDASDPDCERMSIKTLLRLKTGDYISGRGF
jgi:hypothetical protein